MSTLYDQIREDILYARIKPGDLVFEADIAQRFNVSKTPARGALHLLARDGLLQVMPRRGYVVRSMGLDDIVEVFRLRRCLEPALTGDAARRATEPQLLVLREIIGDYATETAWQEQVRIAMRLHHELAVAAANRRAVQIVDGLVFEAHRVWMSLTASPPRPAYEEALEVYQAIVEAVSAREPVAASRKMEELLNTAQANLVNFGVLAGGLDSEHPAATASAP